MEAWTEGKFTQFCCCEIGAVPSVPGFTPSVPGFTRVGLKPPTASNCAAGSLYSCTNGSNCNITGEPDTLWECIGGSTWTAIK
jgi:hypothetical protein